MEERELRDDERTELQDAASAAIAALGVGVDDFSALLGALEARVNERRASSDDWETEAIELGALVAAVYEMGLGWEMVELSWPTGVTEYAVVEMDRSLAILPMLAVAVLFEAPDRKPELRSTFDRLATGERPPGLERGKVAVLLP